MSNSHDAIHDIIEDLTTTGEDVLDEEQMKNLKSYCKISDVYVKTAYDVLMTQLEKYHSEIRYSTFQIIHELFLRSHLFRTLVLFDLRNIFILTLETKPKDNPLPAPVTAAKKLKLFVLSSFYKWYECFGKAYRKLRLGYEYLKYVKKVRFSSLQHETAEQQRKDKELKQKEERLRKNKLEQVDIQFRDMYHDIKTNVTQLENCFELILPKIDNESLSIFERTKSKQLSEVDSASCVDNDDSNGISSHDTLTGSETGLYKQYSVTINLPTRLRVQLNDDNKNVVERTIELKKEMTSQLTSVRRWLRVLLKCGSKDQEKIKTILQLKNDMVGLIEKYDELDIIKDNVKESSDEDDNSEDGEFIDVPEVAEKNTNVMSGSSTSKTNTSTISSGDCSSNDESRKEKLLKVAPVVPFDTDLQHWGEDKISVPSSHKFDSLHRFWKPSEYEESFVPPQFEAAMKSRTTFYQSNETQISRKCRAPLTNGTLCERMDRMKCPFHGMIVDRDMFGKAFNPEDQAKDLKRKHEQERKDRELIQKEIDATLGTTLSQKKKRKKKETPLDKSKTRYARLTKVENKNNRSKIEKKIFNQKAINKVYDTIQTSTRRLQNEKFGSNFNYLH